MSKKQVNSNTEELRPFRCYNCGKLLAKENILVGVVEIKCKSCKAMNLAVGEYELSLDNTTVEQQDRG